MLKLFDCLVSVCAYVHLCISLNHAPAFVTATMKKSLGITLQEHICERTMAFEVRKFVCVGNVERQKFRKPLLDGFSLLVLAELKSM